MTPGKAADNGSDTSPAPARPPRAGDGAECGTVAVCDPGDVRGARLRTWIEQAGYGAAAWYATRDLDHLEREILDGNVRRVVFASVAELMRSLWDGQTAAATWRAPGLQVDFVEAGAELSPATLAELLAAWEAARRRHRAARTVAGLLLGLLAVAAAFGLLWITSAR